MPTFDTFFRAPHGFRPIAVTGQKATDHNVRARAADGSLKIRPQKARPFGFVSIDGEVTEHYTAADARANVNGEVRSDPSVLFTADQVAAFADDVAAWMVAHPDVAPADALTGFLSEGILRRTGSERAPRADSGPRVDPMAALSAMIAARVAPAAPAPVTEDEQDARNTEEAEGPAIEPTA